MSWQQYVDSNLVGTGMVTAAGIYDLQGNPWAYSAGFAVCGARSGVGRRRVQVASPFDACPTLPALCSGLPPSSPPASSPPPGKMQSPLPRFPPAQAQVAEVAAVSAHFAVPSGLASTGATIAGVKYMFVRGEENAEIYVKKVGTRPGDTPCTRTHRATACAETVAVRRDRARRALCSSAATRASSSRTTVRPNPRRNARFCRPAMPTLPVAHSHQPGSACARIARPCL